MTMESLLNTELWRNFEKQARHQQKKPVELLEQVVREYLDAEKAITLVEDISRDARRSGYTAVDAVRLVRQHRKEKRARRAAS